MHDELESLNDGAFKIYDVTELPNEGVCVKDMMSLVS